MFPVLNKVTGGEPHATRRSSGGRRVIVQALWTCAIFSISSGGTASVYGTC
jgi:hypothetical protein